MLHCYQNPLLTLAIQHSEHVTLVAMYQLATTQCTLNINCYLAAGGTNVHNNSHCDNMQCLQNISCLSQRPLYATKGHVAVACKVLQLWTILAEVNQMLMQDVANLDLMSR